MPVETDADRALFVDTDAFGATAVWTSAGGSVSLAAIFDADYQLLSTPFLDGGAEGSSPQIQCRSGDLPADHAQGDHVAIGGVTYRAVEIKPDGTGMTIVRLQET